MKSMKIISLLTLLLLSLALSTGCTIIRYVDNNPNGNNKKEPDPKVVDVLVMVELDRSATSMAESYQLMYTQLVAALAEKKITVRKVALAPMYRRTGGAVPLIWGLDDPNTEFETLGEAVFFFANDDGQNYLREKVDADGENLATLGLDLDTRPLYHPTTSDPQASAYYTTPTDGFIVMQITAKARSCAYSDGACQLNGMKPANYFTNEGAMDTVDWLQLGGKVSLPKGKIFHLLVATGEGMDIDTFIEGCERQPGFPAGKIDYMEPSSKVYFGPLADQIRNAKGHAEYIDMCQAMSPVSGLPAFLQAAGKVRSRF